MIPKLRFSEFIPSWNLLRLEDLTIRITKGTTPKNYSSNGTVSFVKLESIRGGEIVEELCSRIDNDTHFNELNRSILDDGDILLGIAGSLGRVGIVKQNNLPANTNQALAIIRLKDKTIRDFVFYSLQTDAMKKYIRGCTSVGAQPNISLGQTSDYKMAIPCKEECQKIATVLKLADNKINLLTKKKEALETYKKGLMQKIFSQKLRFPEFTDVFRSALMSDVVELRHGYQFRSNDFTNGGIAVIKIKNVIGTNLNLSELSYISSDRMEEFKRFRIEKGDILMSLTGNIGRVIEVEETPFPMLQNYRVGRFVPNEEISSSYLKYLLASDSVLGRFTKLSNQSAQANFGKQDMDKIAVKFPSIGEQNKVAEMLNNIEMKIRLIEKHILLSRKMKKGLLQQMFV